MRLKYCMLGKAAEALFYHGNPTELEEWVGHGMAINPDTKRDTIEGLGMVDVVSESLIERSGGIAIQKGMLLVHTPLWCSEGRERVEGG